MCTRFCPLTEEEAQAVLNQRAGGTRGHAIADVTRPDPLFDAYPGSQVPVYLPRPDGGLEVARLTWGFPLEGKGKAVFNTRIESALSQLRNGRRGLWYNAIVKGRCLVPVRAFYEGHMGERAISKRTGKPVRRQYLFRLPGARAFLLAGVQSEGRFSIVTTRPNDDVAAIHDRMPLVLGTGESSLWLGPDFARLSDRSGIKLDVEPE